MNKQLKKHESEYYHIPKLKGNPIYIIPVIIFGILSYLNLYLLDWELIKIVFGSLEDIEQYIFNISQLINIYQIIMEYILISLMIICFIRIFKKKLESYNEEGLIVGLTVGLTVGLIYGLTVGLIYGLTYGLTGGLIYGLITGLIAGLIYGLIAGLIYGLIYGVKA